MGNRSIIYILCYFYRFILAKAVEIQVQPYGNNFASCLIGNGFIYFIALSQQCQHHIRRQVRFDVGFLSPGVIALLVDTGICRAEVIVKPICCIGHYILIDLNAAFDWNIVQENISVLFDDFNGLIQDLVYLFVFAWKPFSVYLSNINLPVNSKGYAIAIQDIAPCSFQGDFYHFAFLSHIVIILAHIHGKISQTETKNCKQHGYYYGHYKITIFYQL